nr:spore coat U domain-containing protein [Rickettsia tillamookensis]
MRRNYEVINEAISGYLTRLLRRFALRNDDSVIHAAMPARNDAKSGNVRKLIAVLMINIIIPGNATALLATCNPSVPTVNFGTFNVGAVRTTSVTASVTCSALLSLLVSYTVTFSTGSANIYNPRNMVNGVRKLNYNLYKNAAFTQILGNGTSSTVTFTDSYLLGLGPVTRNYTVYALLPSQPLAAAGTFQDTITVTVTQP